MNPELPQVRQNPESMPAIPGGVEYRPPGTTESAERQVGQSAEQLKAGAVEQAGSLAQPAISVVPLPVVSSTASDESISDATNPIIASDEDLIEREWVDQVKKIIVLTKDDPYERARVIAQLQADYLKKRYNKQLGQAEG